MTPADLKAWIVWHGFTITGFCRLTKMHRRSLQKQFGKRGFKGSHGILISVFCHFYDLGYRVEGMGEPGRRKFTPGKYPYPKIAASSATMQANPM
jgi:hypothetical protein